MTTTNSQVSAEGGIESLGVTLTHDPLSAASTIRAWQQERDAEDARKAYEASEADRRKERNRQQIAERATLRQRLPNYRRNDKLVERVRDQACRILAERHEHEFRSICKELREAVGLPPLDEVTIEATPVVAADASKCRHTPQKLPHGIYCKTCNTKLN